MTLKLPDSGARRQFDTGSKRDLAEGKGRFDLMPQGVVAQIYAYLSQIEYIKFEQKEQMLSSVYSDMNDYIYGGDTGAIIAAILTFSEFVYGDIETAFLAVARHFEAGAKKYDDRNWEKGQPLHVFIDSGLRHLTRWSRGDDDEPHDSAFLWNMMCLLWTHETYDELKDLPFNPEYKLGKRE